MDIIFLIYLSKSFVAFDEEMSQYLHVDTLGMNDSILGSLKDLLSVCKGLYGRSLHNSLKWDLESLLVEESYIDIFDVLKCVYDSL